MANSKTNENKTKRKTTKKTAPGSNVTRKSTAKGSTTTRKKGTTQKNSAQRDEGIPMSNEITLVVSFGLVVLMMFSNFGHCGLIGKWLASFFFGIFGCAQFVTPRKKNTGITNCEIGRAHV